MCPQKLSNYIITQYLFFGIIFNLLSLVFLGHVWGQASIAPGATYSQNFNSIGTTAAASLPNGWLCEKNTSVRNVTVAYTSISTSSTENVLAYNSAMSSTASNGLWNFGGGVNAGDQAVGGISSSSASKSVNYFLKLTNSSSTTSIPSFSISYNAERYRNGSNSAGYSIRLYYSITGLANSWTEITSAIASFLGNNDNLGANLNPLQVISITNVPLALSLSANSSIYFAWNYSVTTGTTTSNAQALGIDDVLITAGSPPCTTGTYIGSSGNWNNINNWCSGVVPTSATNVIIPLGATVTIDAAQTTVANLTINSGGTVIVDAGVQLTVTGALTNNGTFSLENGATFVQGNSVTGGGTYNVRQNLDNCATNGTSLTGRFWYLGSPVTSLRETSFGNTGALNKVWSFTNGAYTAITDGTTLVPTTGYVHRRGANASPLTFSGTNLYASDVTLSLSNNAGTYAGWHLVANPYTAYLDWQQVYNASNALSSAISPSYYIRSFNSTGNDVNALITYNSSTGLESNTSSFSLGSTGSTIARYIAPMQAFWVKVNPTTPLSVTAGQLRLERAFTSHQTGNVGLKSSTIFPTLARVNLVDGARFDQLLVYMNSDMTNGVDQYDSEKMFVSGAPQIYTVAAGKKLVMNGLKDNKKKISVPLYLELPDSKVYNLQLAEYILEDGLILLEDKQEGTIQDFTIHDEYTFYANSGVLANRFVLHFYMPDNGITAQGPSNSWVEEETVINEGGNILVNSNGRGKLSILQDIDPSPAAKGNVIVRDAAGRQVWTGQLSGSATLIELDTPSGIYFVEVEFNGQVEMKKIFVQQ